MKQIDLKATFAHASGLQKQWPWLFGAGTLMSLIGLYMIASAYVATIFSVIFFGFLLVSAAMAHLVHTIAAHNWSGLFVSILLAILYGVSGLLCIFKPTIAAIDVTFLIAVLCFIGGLFKMISSLLMRFATWGWVFFNGLITFILGILIFAQWPLSGLWIIGTFVGIDVLLSGSCLIILSLQARKG